VQVLEKLPTFSDPNLLVGFESGDDAAVYKLNDRQALIFTVDFFPPVVDDPFSFGAVAAANSFSDVYAMGGTPICALNIVGFPVDLPKEILSEIMRGGYTKAQEAGCLIAGGHTVDDQEPKYGLAVVGLVEPELQVTNAGAQAGDILVLTKPLGTGIITTAGKQGVVDPQVLAEGVRVMSTLNAAASRAMMKVGVNSATDVTGFGLVGHLRGMMAASGTTARVAFSRMPVIEGAWELLESGVAPGGTHRNLEGVGSQVAWDSAITQNQKLLLCDAQTSGGLLISVAEERREELLRALEDEGVEGSVVIGEVLEAESHPIEVTP